MTVKILTASIKQSTSDAIEKVVRRYPRATRHPRAITYSVRDLFLTDLLIYGGYAAYTFILALFPFIIFLLALASVIGTPQLANQVIDYGFEVFPPELVDILAPVVREIMANNDTGILTVAVVGILWIASSGIEGLRFGLNVMYEAKECRPFWKRRLQSLGLVVITAFAFLLLATLLIVWPLAAEKLAHSLPFLHSYALNILRYAMAFGLLTWGLSILYRYLPFGRRHMREVWHGAIAAAVLWLVLVSLFALYLVNIEEYTMRYGSFAGGILTLVFLQFTASVVLFGGRYNFLLMRIRERDEQRANVKPL